MFRGSRVQSDGLEGSSNAVGTEMDMAPNPAGTHEAGLSLCPFVSLSLCPDSRRRHKQGEALGEVEEGSTFAPATPYF